jgi:hypothetical protein
VLGQEGEPETFQAIAEQSVALVLKVTFEFSWTRTGAGLPGFHRLHEGDLGRGYDRAFRQFDVSETSIFDPPKPLLRARRLAARDRFGGQVFIVISGRETGGRGLGLELVPEQVRGASNGRHPYGR